MQRFRDQSLEQKLTGEAQTLLAHLDAGIRLDACFHNVNRVTVLHVQGDCLITKTDEEGRAASGHLTVQHGVRLDIVVHERIL